MPLHLVKLCVGVSSVEELREHVERDRAASLEAGTVFIDKHTTRMFPRRAAELLDGGSLYWVIKGNVQARQRLIDIRQFTCDDGISRCDLVFEPMVVATAWQPRRAFQGWRYLRHGEVPADLDANSGLAAVAPSLRIRLAELGLL